MSSSGLIYAVIVGAWAAYLVPMWLRRQDELNEARPTERFSTAIRLLSGRAAMERRYAKDLRTRSTDEAEPDADPDAVTDSVDVRAFAVPPTRPQTRVTLPEREGGQQPGADRHERAERHAHVERHERVERTERERVGEPLAESHAAPVPSQSSPSAESSAPSAAPDATRRVPRARRAPSPPRRRPRRGPSARRCSRAAGAPP